MRHADCGSESHHERAYCELIEKELDTLGIPHRRQMLDGKVVTDGWNISARVDGDPAKKPLLFVLHLDTAAPSTQVKTYIQDGRIYSSGSSVLGADGKLSNALLLEAISELRESSASFRPLEILFTVCQELGSIGARYADYSHIESEEALVPDHYVTGEVLMNTPARHFMHVELIGQGAHVIRRNEPGVNALHTAVEILHQIPMGRVDDDLRVNVYDLVSLSLSNAVPGHARFDIEIRTFGQRKWELIREDIRNVISRTSEAAGCKCSISEESDFPESDFSGSTEMIERLERVYQSLGIPMKKTRSFGVMDATFTQQIGIHTLPIGLSIYHSHSASEYVCIDEMETMLQLMKQILMYF